MKSVRLPLPDVWATKISRVPIALKMGPHVLNHSLLYNILEPCWLSVHLVYKGVVTPCQCDMGVVGGMDRPTLE